MNDKLRMLKNEIKSSLILKSFKEITVVFINSKIMLLQVFFYQFCLLDYPRVRVGAENPLRVERGDPAQLECKVDSKPKVQVLF